MVYTKPFRTTEYMVKKDKMAVKKWSFRGKKCVIGREK